MTWKQAALMQLYEIAYNDKEAHIVDKQAAVSEINRRRKKSYVRKNYKELMG